MKTIKQRLTTAEAVLYTIEYEITIVKSLLKGVWEAVEGHQATFHTVQTLKCKYIGRIPYTGLGKAAYSIGRCPENRHPPTSKYCLRHAYTAGTPRVEGCRYVLERGNNMEILCGKARHHATSKYCLRHAHDLGAPSVPRIPTDGSRIDSKVPKLEVWPDYHEVGALPHRHHSNWSKRQCTVSDCERGEVRSDYHEFIETPGKEHPEYIDDAFREVEDEIITETLPPPPSQRSSVPCSVFQISVQGREVCETCLWARTAHQTYPPPWKTKVSGEPPSSATGTPVAAGGNGFIETPGKEHPEYIDDATREPQKNFQVGPF